MNISTAYQGAIFLTLLSFSHLAPANSEKFGEEDFTRKDRSQILYTTKISFTTDNIPVVNIVVMEGKDEIEFSSKGELVLMPEGETGTQVIYPAGSRCKARISSGSPAVISYYPVCGKAAPSDFERISSLKKCIEEKGKKWRAFNLGSIFGFYGTVLDNRVTLIAFDLPSPQRGAAEKVVEELKKEFDCDFSIYEDLTERPGGVIEVRCGGEALVRAQDVIFVSAGQKQFIKLHNVQFAKGYSWEGSEDREYRGQIYIAVDRNGKLAAINSIDAESLLKGLVPSEIYTDAPMEALKAQAIVARGELLAKLGTRHTSDPYMVCAEQHCQVYSGVKKENARTDAAVDETRGEVLFYGKTLVDSVYSASCGGHTESADLVWEGHAKPYLTGKPDSESDQALELTEEAAVEKFILNPPGNLFCGSTKYSKGSFRWETLFDIKTIAAEIGKVKDVRILKRGKSGRVISLEIEGSKGVKKIVGELNIRKFFKNLKSSLFVMTLNRDAKGNVETILFKGGGFGHGSGLCQTGAIGMAAKGKKCPEILKHYYSGSEIRKIY